MEKVNYFLAGEKIIKGFTHRPSLLMHVCCAPCSCYPLTYLIQYFDVALHYNNSNIYPRSEWELRRKELIKFVSDFNRDYKANVKLIIKDYNHEEFMKDLVPLKDEPERGKRCILCYTKRMKEAWQYAEDNHFDYFTTVMTISRQKDSQVLNEIGKKLQSEFKHTKYFYSDFKKNDGILKGQKIRDHYGLYQQNYCGCEYSQRRDKQ
ncbi:MAG: epoxyqueuosine reductase QueH [Bacilli bacterium]|nr:epoxyqueuosine reductase QueH [Bacilli bacterium]